VHDDEPEVFETRWALSYLRGPLTRAQIKLLMDPLKATAAPQSASPSVPAPAPVATAPSKTERAILPPEISQYYIPVRSSGVADATLTYHPMLLGTAEVRYSNSKTVEMTQQLNLLAAFADRPVSLDWSQAAVIDLPVEDLESEPEAGAQFAEVPPEATKAKNYASWRKDLASWIYRNQRLELLESPTLDIVSNPAESNDCGARCGTFDEGRGGRRARAGKCRGNLAEACGSRSGFSGRDTGARGLTRSTNQTTRDSQSQTDESKHRRQGADARLGALLERQTRVGINLRLSAKIRG
jgi:hypothetical protein